MVQAKDDLIQLGWLGKPHGIRGWLKLRSETEPEDAIFEYADWWLQIGSGWQRWQAEASAAQSKDWLVKLAGCEDRDAAQALAGAAIAVERGRLPELDEDEHYWADLEGLQVVTEQGQVLGRVDHLMATGANDVLVVRGDAQAIDQRERLLPYLPDEVIREVSLAQGVIRVAWDPEF